MLYSIIADAEIICGSFELLENIKAAKDGVLSEILDAMINTYLESFTPEERAERKRLADIRPQGILHP